MRPVLMTITFNGKSPVVKKITQKIPPITKTRKLEESLLSDTFDDEIKIIKLEKQKPS
jgi:hypothetical protein